MSSMKKLAPLGVLSTFAWLGCSSAVPKELVDARVAYDRASHGPAQEWSPADLHTAQQALARAEAAFEDDGDSANTRDFAYIAQRKAQIAEAKARTIAAEHQASQAEAQASTTMQQAHAQTLSQLQETQRKLQDQNTALTNEQQKRAEAEKRAQQAMTDLARVAAVKQEARGTVITLSGSVLFESGEADLLSGAESRLAQVADALTTRDPDSAIVVEGYTDSQGSRRFNEKLSQDRAEAVRSYLISRGVAPDRIRARGLGPEKPVADNTSPEGRANNRRVEIVLEPQTGQQGAPTQQPNVVPTPSGV